MSELHNRSQISARRSDYVWQYEYYDEEEPVSFEGLRAHRYSIVIGFWVGLAVFVIFMFFVLTLLTKTGAPHQENPDSAEKRHRPGSCLLDIDGQKDKSDKAFSRPLLTGTRSYFHFYVNEEGQAQRGKTRGDGGGSFKDRRGSRSSDVMVVDLEDAEARRPLNGLLEERERAFISQYNIPNFVNLEHSSTLGEDDLVHPPSGALERHSQTQDNPRDTH